MSHCTSDNTCRIVSPGHKFPNGLAYNRGPQGDGLLYVPSSLLGRVYAYKPVLSSSGGGDGGDGKRGDLQLVATIDAGFSLDNISPDANGDMYIAAFPKVTDLLAAYANPYGSSPATASVRVPKGKKVAAGPAGGDNDVSWAEFEVDKIIEDGAGGRAEILPGTTTVVHDAATGRLFFSSKFRQLSCNHPRSLEYLLRLGLSPLCKINADLLTSSRCHLAIHWCLRASGVVAKPSESGLGTS